MLKFSIKNLIEQPNENETNFNKHDTNDLSMLPILYPYLTNLATNSSISFKQQSSNGFTGINQSLVQNQMFNANDHSRNKTSLKKQHLNNNNTSNNVNNQYKSQNQHRSVKESIPNTKKLSIESSSSSFNKISPNINVPSIQNYQQSISSSSSSAILNTFL